MILRCSFGAELRGDQREGTAAPVQRWLLIEQPGPWGRNAILESRLNRRIAASLAARAARAGLRVLLIRRPGRREVTTARHWAYVDSRPGREALRWSTFEADEELLDIPLDGSVGAVSLDPAYLICTHGRHDTCCALRGRPIAAALAAVRPAGTWECSHLGGDRFAPNLLVLPYGFYYGHVDAAAAISIVSATERGRVEPTWLRGRSSLPAAVQVAQQHARLALHESAASAFAPLRVEPIAEPTGWRVVLDSDEGPVVVVLRAQLSNPPALLTCSSGHPERVTELHLVSLTGPGAGSSTDVDR